MRILLFYVFFYSTFFFGQNRKIDSKWTINDSIITEINQNSIIQYSLINHDIVSRLDLINPNNIILDNYDLLNYEKKYLYKKTGGILYELKENTLIRSDNSYDHKLHTRSLKFNYNNTIMVLGGYGFFTRRNDIVYYSKKKKELFSNFLKVYFPKRVISDVIFNYVLNYKLLFCGGLTSSLLNRSVPEKIDKCYETNLLNYSTKELLGSYNSFFKKQPTDYIQMGKNIWIFYGDLLVVLDIESLSGYLYELDTSVHKIIGIEDGILHFLTQNPEENKDSIETINTEHFLNKNGKPIKVLNNYIPYYLYLLIGFVLIYFMFFIYKKTNYPVSIKSRKVFYKKTILTRDKEWVFIIQKLKENTLIKNEEFLDLINKTHLDIGHQNRIKNQLINEINNRSFYLSNKNLILKTKWEKDKRINIYYLNNRLIKSPKLKH